MKTAVNFKREIDGDVDSAIERVTFALKAEGFGVVPRQQNLDDFRSCRQLKTA